MSRIGQLLAEQGLISDDQLRTALRNQRVLGGRLGTCLLEMGSVSEELFLKTLSRQLSVPAAELEELRIISPEVAGLLSARLALRYQAFPFRSLSNQVDVAMLNPQNLAHHDELAFVIDKPIRVHVAPEARIAEALHKLYGGGMSRRIEQLLERLDAQTLLGQSPVPSSLTEAPLDFQVDEEALLRLPDVPVFEPPAAAPTPPTPSPPRSHTPDPAPQIDWPRIIREIKPQLAHAANANGVGRVLIEELGKTVSRCLLLRVRRGQAEGWLARGDGLDTRSLRALRLRLDEPSVLRELQSGEGIYRGRLRPKHLQEGVSACWRGESVADWLVLAIRIENRLVAALMIDEAERWLTDLEVSHLQSLAEQSGAALQKCIIRNKLQQAGEDSATLTSR